jgi:nucleoside-diphosphate-sugar epimerase
MAAHTSSSIPISKSVFITGAAGAVGRTVAVTFRRHGYTVYGLVRSAERARKAVLAMEEVIPVIGDSADPSTYCHIIAKCGIIVEASTLTPSDDFIKKMIHEAQKGKTETGDLKVVLWVTGFMQYPFEEALYKSEGVKFAAVRPSFLYGSNGGPAFQYAFFASRKEGEKVKVYGNKDKHWPWCHVFDLGEAVTIIVNNIDKVKGGYIRVGSGDHMPTYEEIMIASARADGYTGDFEYVEPTEEFHKIVEIDVPKFDNSLILSLGWKPRFENKDLIANIPVLLASYKAFYNQ